MYALQIAIYNGLRERNLEGNNTSDRLYKNSWFRRLDQVLIRIARRSRRRIEASLRRWAAVARARVAFRPGGAGYLQTRRNFLVNSGQSRATRRYSPY